VVYDVHHKTRSRLGSTASLVWKGMKILVITAYDPAALGLPVVVVDKHFELVIDPIVGGNVASLAGH